MKKVDIIVPCYNEACVLHMFFEKTTEVTDSIKRCEFRYIFVDDGSSDGTSDIIKQFAHENHNVKYISFSRNFGKEAAMYAGLQYSEGDYAVIIDADLQHPPALIRQMIDGIEEGYDSCAAVRMGSRGESWLRRGFSGMFYTISNRLTDISLMSGAVDYRIMSRRMVEAVLKLSEVQRFSKGIFEWVGFDTKWIPYESVKRPVGKTKWSFMGLFKYAADGITSFSIAPLRIVTAMGFIISVTAFIYIIITLIQTLIVGISVPGYVTTLCAVLFLGGIIELSVGILGEYIGHIYMESKDRPIYILKETNIISKEK